MRFLRSALLSASRGFERTENWPNFTQRGSTLFSWARGLWFLRIPPLFLASCSGAQPPKGNRVHGSREDLRNHQRCRCSGSYRGRRKSARIQLLCEEPAACFARSSRGNSFETAQESESGGHFC